jgi:lipoate-protein ligase A
MILFENDSTDAAFFFAAEEYIMRILKPEEPVLMLWVTDDTVMIGANQIVKAEIDEAYAEEAGIDIVRRPSGGGTIFTDRGTLQYTVILPYGVTANAEAANGETEIAGDDPKACMKEWLAEPLIDTLGRFGVCASLEGRNDVTIDGKKISGLAQHIKDGYICSHGSLLFSTDLDKLARVLTVSKEKIQSKAIPSVSARVAKISDHIEEKDIRVFRESFIMSYGKMVSLRRRGFTEKELGEINKIMRKRYINPVWTYGREPAFTFTNKIRFPGGQVEVFLVVKGGIIKNAVIRGDFLALRPVTELEAGLVGIPHRKEALRDALRSQGVKSALGSITEEELLQTLI